MSDVVDRQGMVAVEVTTDAAGDFTGTSPVVTGKTVNAIRLVDTDLAAGADFTITETKTGQALLTEVNAGASETWYPAVLLNDLSDGSPLVAVYARPSIGHSTITVVVAQGGDTKTGIFYFLLI